MFETHQKSTGSQFTMMIALLIGAFIFSPAMLAMSRPFGDVAVSLALAGSAVCAALAWVSWTKYSQLTIPTLEPAPVRVK